ncbi:MAG TPA: tetratricopeptide repeat protein [Candidatus Obscuribacter sp.]|nr:tetratricopeptide repeat protein [Candidatus Obscuribacter sp.]
MANFLRDKVSLIIKMAAPAALLPAFALSACLLMGDSSSTLAQTGAASVSGAAAQTGSKSVNLAGLYAQGNYTGALAAARSELAAAASNRTTRGKALSNLSAVLRFTGSPQEALDAALEAHELCPNDAVVLANLATLTCAYGDRDQALPLYQECLRLSPRDWLAHMGLAQALAFSYSADLTDGIKAPDQSVSQLQQARVELEKAQSLLAEIKDAPGNYWLQLGDSNLLLRQYSRALFCYEQGQRSPGRAEERSLCLEKALQARLARGDGAQTAALAARVLQNPVVDAETYKLILVRLVPSLPTDAGGRLLTAVEKRLRSDPLREEDAALKLSLGRRLEESGRLGEARKYFLAAYKSRPENLSFALALSRCLFLDGERQRSQQIVVDLFKSVRNKEMDAGNLVALRAAGAALELTRADSGDLAYSLRQALSAATAGGGSAGGGNSGNSGKLYVSRATVGDWQCACNMNSIRYVLLKRSGVVYAHLQPASPGKAMVLLRLPKPPGDAARLWGGLEKMVKVKSISPLTTLSDFPNFAKTILDAEEAYYEPVVSVYNFSMPPMRIQ